MPNSAVPDWGSFGRGGDAVEFETDRFEIRETVIEDRDATLSERC
jgi:hypothetical protein